MTERLPPTPAMAHCMAAIVAMTDDRGGIAPSVRELALELGYSRPAALHGLLCDMRDRGLVTWTPAMARTLRVVGQTFDRQALERLADAELQLVVNLARAILAERKAAQFQ